MKSLAQVLNQPVRLFVVTSVGLAAALVSDGTGDLIGWLCLAYVVGTAVRFSIGRTRTAASSATAMNTVQPLRHDRSDEAPAIFTERQRRKDNSRI